MNYLDFDRTQLINLRYSLNREFLRTNRAGSFACSTIVNCHTRKYHGLLICPLDEVDGGNHVLLSALDETIVQHDKEFHLAVREYPNIFHSGHKYIYDLQANPIPTYTYRVGGVVLKKEMLLAQEEETMLLRYTLVEAHSPTKLWLHPFLAFRNIHALSKENMDVITKAYPVKNGMKTKMYDVYPYLYMQCSKSPDYIPAPLWFNNVLFRKEKERGYDYLEDLFVPGYFEIPLKKGEQVVFAAGLKETSPTKLKQKFDKEVELRIPRTGFDNCLKNSAEQFIVRKGKQTAVVSGYPWFGTWARDTFIALPGLTCEQGDTKTCKEVLDTITDILEETLFKLIQTKDGDVNSVDNSLWFFWALQQYAKHTNLKTVWKDYGQSMKNILNGYRRGTNYNIKMHDNGLIYAGEEGKALTWMNAIVNGKPVTPRPGYVVEVNALWYNAVCFALEVAEKVKDTEFLKEWSDIPQRIADSFVATFWSDEKQYLADYVNGDYKDWAVRPNQIIAASVKYTPLDEQRRKATVDIVKKQLLTPRGIRTLSPKNPQYKGTCNGNVIEKDLAYHQGTAWPWLFGHFTEAYLRLHGKGGLGIIKRYYHEFENEIDKHGVGTISEIYDGDPPHEARGAISFASSVAELIRVKKLIEHYENQ